MVFFESYVRDRRSCDTFHGLTHQYTRGILPGTLIQVYVGCVLCPRIALCSYPKPMLHTPKHGVIEKIPIRLLPVVRIKRVAVKGRASPGHLLVQLLKIVIGGWYKNTIEPGCTRLEDGFSTRLNGSSELYTLD